jgi:putative phosphoesterase
MRRIARGLPAFRTARTRIDGRCMKIGVLSDTHVPAAAPSLPRGVFEIFQGVDLILHAGDIVELAVLDALRALAPVEAVAGNVDGPEVRRVLSSRKVLSLGAFTVGLVHGTYRLDVQHDMIRKEFGAVDLIVYGHSHRAFWGRVGDVLMLNPGSPTDCRHAPFHSVALLTVDTALTAQIVRL